MSKALWKPDWTKAPPGTIGASFNPDGIAWFWSTKPEIKGSEKRPYDLKWRGPVYSEGYTMIGPVDSKVRKALWKDSWIPNPKAGK